MSEPQSDRPIDLGALAAEPPEESTRDQLNALGDVPDVGDVTPPDSAQHDPDSDSSDEQSAGLLSARLPFSTDRA